MGWAAACVGRVAQGVTFTDGGWDGSATGCFVGIFGHCVEREFLAFRHLFRGASIVLMRWEKLLPLLLRAGDTHDQVDTEIRAFIGFLEGDHE